MCMLHDHKIVIMESTEVTQKLRQSGTLFHMSRTTDVVLPGLIDIFMPWRVKEVIIRTIISGPILISKENLVHKRPVTKDWKNWPCHF